MSRDDTLSYDDLIRELRRLCLEGRTGTLFIATSDNRAVRIVVQRGEITHVIARGQIGLAAVASIKEVTGARVMFSGGATDSGNPQSLPTTSELLAMLGGGEPTATDAAGTTALLASLQQARAIIEPELAEYLGPMAAMLYEELVTRIDHGRGAATFHEAIDHLAGELRNPAEASRFKDSVRARLAAAAIKALP